MPHQLNYKDVLVPRKQLFGLKRVDLSINEIKQKIFLLMIRSVVIVDQNGSIK